MGETRKGLATRDNLILAITGASGAPYCVRLLEVLLATGCDVHLTISPAGQAVLKQELDVNVDLDNFRPEALLPSSDLFSLDDKILSVQLAAGVSTGHSNVLSVSGDRGIGRIRYHHYQDYFAPIASGSFLSGGMVICPCSGSTLSAIAHGASTNLIHRAADVQLKERRKLILVTRETPLSIIHLDNMRRCVEAGAVVLPASPGFYHEPRSIQDLVDFVVGRVCDQLNITHALMRRWGEPAEEPVPPPVPPRKPSHRPPHK